jgi:steroid 5-alpha reductase family enzyme
MIALWLVGTIRNDVSIVDPFWGVGFLIVGWVAWYINSPVVLRVLILIGLTTIWGVRLSLFLLWRNWGQGEDRRYAAMRAHRGHEFWWMSLFTVFLLQAGLLWIVSLPIQYATGLNSTSPLGWLDAFGIAIWVLGFMFEAVGDWQLSRFKMDPNNAGGVMDHGLWRYTRHPNYFGEFCVWWGMYLVAAAGGASLTVVSPLLISFLLLKVSGVSMLERTIVSRRPDYVAYMARTNAFFPGPPRPTGSRQPTRSGKSET